MHSGQPVGLGGRSEQVGCRWVNQAHPPMGGLCSPISQGWMASLHPTLSQHDETWELVAWRRQTVEPRAGSISKTGTSLGGGGVSLLSHVVMPNQLPHVVFHSSIILDAFPKVHALAPQLFPVGPSSVTLLSFQRLGIFMLEGLRQSRGTELPVCTSRRK